MHLSHREDIHSKIFILIHTSSTFYSTKTRSSTSRLSSRASKSEGKEVLRGCYLTLQDSASQQPKDVRKTEVDLGRSRRDLHVFVLEEGGSEQEGW